MSSIEIFVRDVAIDSLGRKVIVAVPNNFLDVSLNDCFVSCCEVHRNDVINGIKNPKRLNIKKISLKVEKIDSGRGNFVSHAKHGQTVGFYFSGEGIDDIKKGLFLRTEETTILC